MGFSLMSHAQDIIEADRAAFFAWVLRADATPRELLEDYLRYHGPLFDDQRQHFARALREAFQRQGASVPCDEVLDSDDAIAADFLARHAPHLHDAYFDLAGVEEFEAHEVFGVTPNQYQDTSVPTPPALRIGRRERAQFRIYRAGPGELFLYQYGYQYYHPERNVSWREARSRCFPKLVTAYPMSSTDRPVVMIQDAFDGGNFAHFLFDWLPRLVHFIRARLEEPSRCLFVLGTKPGPFQTLLLGTVARRHGLTDANFLAPEVRCRLELRGRFYFFSDQKQIPLHPAHMMHPQSLQIIRDILAVVPPARGPYRRVFLSRSDTRLRRLVNESELMHELHRLRFQVIRMADYDIATQIALLRGAELLVGAHGMGFTNIVAHEGKLRMMELFHPRIGSDAYMFAARAMGFDYDYLIGREVNDAAAGYMIPRPDFAAASRRFFGT